jgi:site-specific recombinase XerD
VARKLAAVRALLRHALGPTRVPDASFAPRRPRRLPDAPKTAELEETLDRLDGAGPLGLRNRALVELVYSAGLRSREAVDLDLGDVEFEQELIRVRGKGGKERVVPLRDAPARGRRRPEDDPGAARPQLALDDAGLLARRRAPPA